MFINLKPELDNTKQLKIKFCCILKKDLLTLT